jgi:hypothetical protein
VVALRIFDVANESTIAESLTVLDSDARAKSGRRNIAKTSIDNTMA